MRAWLNVKLLFMFITLPSTYGDLYSSLAGGQRIGGVLLLDIAALNEHPTSVSNRRSSGGAQRLGIRTRQVSEKQVNGALRGEERNLFHAEEPGVYKVAIREDQNENPG